ncbi:MAG: hypothetical protein K6T66_11415 [Peptococcaceae bacterium]|nr:hypothetical protein [Peptococcaceae bacterium]
MTWHNLIKQIVLPNKGSLIWMSIIAFVWDIRDLDAKKGGPFEKKVAAFLILRRLAKAFGVAV